MSEQELRALLSYYASQLTSLNDEPSPGYGFIHKARILEILDRMTTLAKELEG